MMQHVVNAEACLRIARAAIGKLRVLPPYPLGKAGIAIVSADTWIVRAVLRQLRRRMQKRCCPLAPARSAPPFGRLFAPEAGELPDVALALSALTRARLELRALAGTPRSERRIVTGLLQIMASIIGDLETAIDDEPWRDVPRFTVTPNSRRCPRNPKEHP